MVAWFYLAMNPLRNAKHGVFYSLLGTVVLCLGCQSVGYHSDEVQKNPEKSDRLTVGKVQREIKVGMSSADVAGVLGSPNIVTTDDQRRESWVYDKVATTATYSKSEGGVFLLLGSVGGGSGASSTSQKTLTIIIKFDAMQKVRDFSYHSSSF